MQTIIKYIEEKTKVSFGSIKDRECFYSGSVLYMKILQQDLDHFKIDNINAISIINAGLTFFDLDETVYRAVREVVKFNNKH
uniref:hypothetical protein n=1 Tax=Clostridium sp. 12(A) TaxID=1163671 RepID=UPI000463C47E|nr:hypothetical protein [Clostridium sp. 12(A)]